jgi:hypothetical protein
MRGLRDPPEHAQGGEASARSLGGGRTVNDLHPTPPPPSPASVRAAAVRHRIRRLAHRMEIAASALRVFARQIRAGAEDLDADRVEATGALIRLEELIPRDGVRRWRASSQAGLLQTGGGPAPDELEQWAAWWERRASQLGAGS